MALADGQILGKSSGLAVAYPLAAHLLDTAAVALRLAEGPFASLASTCLGRHASDADRRGLAAAAGLHDIGKASPAFQKILPNATALAGSGYDFGCGSPLRHEVVTRLGLPEALATAGCGASLGTSTTGMLGLAASLGGHHGLFGQVTRDETRVGLRGDLPALHRKLGTGVWAEQRVAHVKVVLDALGTHQPFVPASVAQAVALCGFTILADWIASQEHFIIAAQGRAGANMGEDWDVHYRAQYRHAQTAVHLAGLTLPQPSTGTFRQVFGFDPRPLQATLDEHLVGSVGPGIEGSVGPGIVVVTAPMGLGKTEAALMAARRFGAGRGLFFGLPTMATADAMFGRLADYVRQGFAGGEVSLGLAHSMALLSEAYTGLPDMGSLSESVSDDPLSRAVAASWIQGRGRVLLAPIAAGTIDQLLAGSLRMKRVALRWASFANKTVIIDEAHALDAYMHGLLQSCLEWLGALGVPVVVLSATLPTRIMREMVEAWCHGAGVTLDPAAPMAPAYPGWVHVDRDTLTVTSQTVDAPLSTITLRECRYEPDGAPPVEAVIGLLSPIVEDEGTAMVVCNTVRDAQSVTEALLPWAAMHDVDLLCLHARMPHADRRARVEDVFVRYGKPGVGIERPRRGVVVATQVIEQSLDVDFDLIVSFLAPIAPLLQRAGRGHRHERPRPRLLSAPTVEVLVPIEPGGALKVPFGWRTIYPTVYLTGTHSVLFSNGAVAQVRIPGGVQRIVDVVYATPEDLDDPALDPELRAQTDREWLDARTANQSARIPVPDDVRDLSELSKDVDELLLMATRLGVASQLVVCAYRTMTGVALDPGGLTPVIDRPDRAATRALLDRSVPLTNSTFTTELGALNIQPQGWADNPWLAEALLIELDPATASTSVGRWDVRLDPLTGLHIERT